MITAIVIPLVLTLASPNLLVENSTQDKIYQHHHTLFGHLFHLRHKGSNHNRHGKRNHGKHKDSRGHAKDDGRDHGRN